MRLRWSSLSLRSKFILEAVAVILVLTSVMSLLVLNRVKRAQEAEVMKRGQTLAEQLGRLAQFPMRTGDKGTLDKLARDALLLEDVQAIEFLGPEGELLVKVERESPASSRVLGYSYPVRRTRGDFRDEMDFFQGAMESPPQDRVGIIKVTLSLLPTDRMIREIRSTIVAVAVVLATLAILFSVHFARRITDPIQNLIKGVEKIGEGKLDVEIEPIEDGEIGLLAQHFNKMAKDLKQSINQMIQQEKMASLGRMASSLSHEIGSPLNSILIDARMLLDEVGEGRAKRSAEAITNQVRRMRDTVRNLLDYARIPPDEIQAVDIAGAMDEAMLILANPIRKSGININRKVPKNLPSVRAIKTLTIQVFVNLIANAIEATGKGGKLEIGARLEPEESRVLVCFTDNGPGIPEQALDSIFEPFYTTKPEGEGTGLGLSICYQIMKGFSGDIIAERPKGGGLKFILKFQALKDENIVSKNLRNPA
jgi:signal transduction histidine kinase